MTAQVGVAVIVGVVATAEDLARRQISNWIPLAALVGGLVCQSVTRGWRGAVSSLLGAIAGFCVFLIFYWLGGMGGGDVKLMSGFGAVVGIEHLLEAALWTAAAGGLLALAALALGRVWSWFRRKDPAGRGRPAFIPYAPAITLGAWLSLVPRA